MMIIVLILGLIFFWDPTLTILLGWAAMWFTGDILRDFSRGGQRNK